MEINITIEGRTPLICNRFSDERAIDSTGGTRGSSAAVERQTPQDIAYSKLYLVNNRPTIPQPNLLSSLVGGGQFHKAGKKQITTQKSSMLYACVDIEGVALDIIHKQPWKVDTRPVRIPSTGGRILCHRPMFDDWRLEFTVHLDTSILSQSIFRLIVDDAGNRVGLGDYRPMTKGPYGRFHVVRWEVAQPEALPIAAE
jgi:hypothetical protein